MTQTVNVLNILALAYPKIEVDLVKNPNFFRSKNKKILTCSILLVLLTWLIPTSTVWADTADVKLETVAKVNVKPHRTKIHRLVKYIKDKYQVAEQKADAIVTEAVRNAVKQDVEPELILAVIAVESTFKEKAVSRAGARGLMQVMPRHHPKKIKEIGGTRALFDAKKNI